MIILRETSCERFMEDCYHRRSVSITDIEKERKIPMDKLKKLIDLGKEFGAGLTERRLALYAASGTYNIFLSIVPVITLIVSLVQFLPFTPEYMLSLVSEWLPEQVMTVMERIINGIYRGGKAAFTISILLTVFSASAAMRVIMQGIDAAYNSLDVKQNIVVYYARAILYTVVFAAVLLLSFVVMAYGGGIMESVLRLFPDIPLLAPLFSVLKYVRYLLVMALLFPVFLLLYRFIPKARVKLKEQWAGALFASLTWVVFSAVFSFYISLSDKFGAYGVIGTVMVAMMWLYYSIFFLLIGGWLNCFLKNKKEDQPQREENITAAN